MPDYDYGDFPTVFDFNQQAQTTQQQQQSTPSNTYGAYVGQSSNIPYGTFPWVGMPDYATKSLEGLFSGQGGTGVAGGVWDWLESISNRMATTQQPAVDTSLISQLAATLADPARSEEWGRATRAGIESSLQHLQENVFTPIFDQLSDRTGFLNSTTTSQALSGAMSNIGQQVADSMFKAYQAQQQMATQGLESGLKGQALVAEYKKDQLNRQLNQMLSEGKIGTETAKALDTLLYAIRRQEDPLAPYKALLDFAK